MFVLLYQKRSIYSNRTITPQDLDQYTLTEQSMHNMYDAKQLILITK